MQRNMAPIISSPYHQKYQKTRRKTKGHLTIKNDMLGMSTEHANLQRVELPLGGVCAPHAIC